MIQVKFDKRRKQRLVLIVEAPQRRNVDVFANGAADILFSILGK